MNVASCGCDSYFSGQAACHCLRSQGRIANPENAKTAGLYTAFSLVTGG